MAHLCLKATEISPDPTSLSVNTQTIPGNHIVADESRKLPLYISLYYSCCFQCHKKSSNHFFPNSWHRKNSFFFFFFSRRFQEYPKILVSKAHYFICYTYFVILICSLSIFISSSFTITVFTLQIWMSQICVIASGSHVILQIILALCLSKSKILCQGSCHKIDLCSQKKKKNNVWRA